MSRKFHDVRSGKKALFYGSANALGPFRPKPKKRKTAPSAANTENGKQTPQDS